MKENKDLNKPIDDPKKILGNGINQVENKSSVQNANDINQIANKSSVQNANEINIISENDKNLQENTDFKKIETEIDTSNQNNLLNRENTKRELNSKIINPNMESEKNLLKCNEESDNPDNLSSNNVNLRLERDEKSNELINQSNNNPINSDDINQKEVNIDKSKLKIKNTISNEKDTSSEIKEENLNPKKEVENKTIQDQTNNKKDILIKKEPPSPVKAKTKPVKEPPIEKKPFTEFVNDYLIPEIKKEFKARGKEINEIYLKNENRPIAEDLCWVIYCEINDTCNFWLSFEKDDITSAKSFSLCKSYEKPSIIESFLIDEKKITLKLIISRILQRLNGQKLIGAN